MTKTVNIYLIDDYFSFVNMIIHEFMHRLMIIKLNMLIWSLWDSDMTQTMPLIKNVISTLIDVLPLSTSADGR